MHYLPNMVYLKFPVMRNIRPLSFITCTNNAMLLVFWSRMRRYQTNINVFSRYYILICTFCDLAFTSFFMFTSLQIPQLLNGECWLSIFFTGFEGWSTFLKVQVSSLIVYRYNASVAFFCDFVTNPCFTVYHLLNVYSINIA